jgi:hypothetical protein
MRMKLTKMTKLAVCRKPPWPGWDNLDFFCRWHRVYAQSAQLGGVAGWQMHEPLEYLSAGGGFNSRKLLRHIRAGVETVVLSAADPEGRLLLKQVLWPTGATGAVVSHLRTDPYLAPHRQALSDAPTSVQS